MLGEATVLPFCPACRRFTHKTDANFCIFCGESMVAQREEENSENWFEHEAKTSSPMSPGGLSVGRALKLVAFLLVILVIAVVVLPAISYIASTSVGQTHVPVISQVTYTARITTLGGQNIRYNVISWSIQRGAMLYTVSLYYINGSSEIFHYVVSYRFERS